MIAKEAMMQRVPTLKRFAHFYGATTINGRKQIVKNKKRHPTQNRPMKYG